MDCASVVGFPAELARRVRSASALLAAQLLAERTPDGHWAGELSSSALSTATAVTALAVVARFSAPSALTGPLRAGLDWLAAHSNPDGGWGDTVRSLSNLSTTTLVWAAFAAVPGRETSHATAVARAEEWIQRHVGGLDPDRLGRAIIARYGRDRTFSVPILTACALSGALGDGRAAWRRVIPLPFELAVFPHGLYAALRLPVVSYALPALIAIGQARHHHSPSRNPLLRGIRSLMLLPALRILERLQPPNGGFLEATPLTSFVTMSLAGSGQAGHPVATKGTEFLLGSQRSDGSWPIDTNLATWLTTLAVHALRDQWATAKPAAIVTLRDWLLRQQHRVFHPYTHAAPGGWAWTDLPGGVPDADDTAGALLALRQLDPTAEPVRRAIPDGLRWLLDLQNRDGGIPTFCRGWGALPFDRSSPDLTAHALRAWLNWSNEAPPDLQQRLQRASRRALAFLQCTQRADGAWLPLWFGNQRADNEANPTYGTARVLCALAEFMERRPGEARAIAGMAEAAVRWLGRAQNADGGWGGDAGVASSPEESALAVEALAVAVRAGLQPPTACLSRGVGWMVDRLEKDPRQIASPIGFYFARLWYFEKLYPVIFTVAALRAVEELKLD